MLSSGCLFFYSFHICQGKTHRVIKFSVSGSGICLEITLQISSVHGRFTTLAGSIIYLAVSKPYLVSKRLGRFKT